MSSTSTPRRAADPVPGRRFLPAPLDHRRAVPPPWAAGLRLLRPPCRPISSRLITARSGRAALHNPCVAIMCCCTCGMRRPRAAGTTTPQPPRSLITTAPARWPTSPRLAPPTPARAPAATRSGYRPTPWPTSAAPPLPPLHPSLHSDRRDDRVLDIAQHRVGSAPPAGLTAPRPHPAHQVHIDTPGSFAIKAAALRGAGLQVSPGR